MKVKSDMLGNERIGKLIIKLSFPAMIALIVCSLYNIVDTIFLGKGVGTLAIGALTIVNPIQGIIMAIAVLFGMGASSIISRHLGSGAVEEANKVLGNAMISVLVVSLFMTLFGLLLLDPVLHFFGATESILPYAKSYMSIILLGCVFLSFTMSMNNVLRAEGNAKQAMIVMILGAVLNIILDPIFIFGLNLGVRGAAIATVISQFISFLYILNYFHKKSNLTVKIKYLLPNIFIITSIVTIGFSSFVRNISVSILAIIMNNTLATLGGDDIIAIYGIVSRILMFVCLPFYGVVQGIQPIIGYNYGADKKERVYETIKKSLKLNLAIGICGFIVVMLFAIQIISLFTNDSQIIKDGARILRIILLMTPIIGIQTIGSSLFQALGKAKEALFLTMLRQVVLLIPLVLVLPMVLSNQLLGVWIAFPISDFFATCITSIYLLKELKELKKNHVNIESYIA